jgi:hypothetical protein
VIQQRRQERLLPVTLLLHVAVHGLRPAGALFVDAVFYVAFELSAVRFGVLTASSSRAFPNASAVDSARDVEDLAFLDEFEGHGSTFNVFDEGGEIRLRQE